MNFQKDDLFLSGLDATNAILESVLLHDVHFSVSVIDKNELSNVNISKYESLCDYNKEVLNTWEFFTYILEKFAEKYILNIEKKLSNQVLFERVEIFINSKKSVKFTNEEFNFWNSSLMILLMFLFDETNYDNEGIFLCLQRLMTSFDVYDFNYSPDILNIIDDLVEIIVKKLEKNEFLLFFRKAFFLVQNKSISINKYGSLMLEKLILKRPKEFETVNIEGEENNNNRS